METVETGEAPTRLSRRRERRKAEIVRVAISLLATSGYQGMGLDDVADGADIAKPTLYHYFSSKDELVSAALETLSNNVLDRLTAVLEDAPGEAHRDRLHALVNEQIRIMTEEYPEVGTIFAWQTSWPEMHDEARKSMRRRHDAIFRQVVTAGVESGELDCANIDVALQCLHGIINNASIWLSQMKDPGRALAAQRDLVTAVMRIFTPERS
ncbi:TetR/AcrR family transcriptional regulator [Hoyosella altamirensis]|uniref:AcrR family transcriptional regulator n=1 Tax=Hoyosella altamirensis TaxID=616997 RepID=A0A839RJX0_9ACTN|nr:TetR/AcrR family transcriptional regulator [Hoyosella altamirensis]MBB3036528.1 AcrR family transcriptional regulator [Hoyosella altamirensis]